MFRIIAITIVLLLVPTMTEAQQSAQVPRVGVLVPELDRPESQAIKGLRDGLHQLGYQEGKNIFIEIQNAKGDRSALAPMAGKLVRQRVNLIFTTGTRATRVAKDSTSDIPIVFTHPADPVVLGLVKSMARPGGNVTGVAAFSLQMTERRLEVLKEIVPKVRRVLIFYDANNDYARENFALAQQATPKLGLEVAGRPIKSADELKKTFNRIKGKNGDALLHMPDDLVEGEIAFIFKAARQNRLPTMSYEELWVIKGALAAYGPSYRQMGRQAARLADKALKGQKPQNLPVERSTKSVLAINFRAASIMGLTIPSEVLKRADLVIR